MYYYTTIYQTDFLYLWIKRKYTATIKCPNKVPVKYGTKNLDTMDYDAGEMKKNAWAYYQFQLISQPHLCLGRWHAGGYFFFERQEHTTKPLQTRISLLRSDVLPCRSTCVANRHECWNLSRCQTDFDNSKCSDVLWSLKLNSQKYIPI